MTVLARYVSRPPQYTTVSDTLCYLTCWMICAVALWFTAPWAQAQTANDTTLKAVDIGNLPGGRVQLRFLMSKPVPKPSSFTINEPARIVLDFVGVSNALAANQQTINQGVAEQVTVLEGDDRTRASINLARLVPYTIVTQGNAVILTLETGSSNNVAASPSRRSSTATARAPTRRTASGRPSITDLDFRRGVEGQGILSVRLTNPDITVDVREQGDKIIADFSGATLPRGQERRLDVIDFATPVTLIDAINRNGNARITVSRLTGSEFLAYQTDDRYTIEVRPIVEDEEITLDSQQKVYSGELLSLNFQDIEVRAVLQIIADFTGLNVVVSDTVQGNLTLRLQNVPWDQALDIILRTKGLTQRQNGNVIYIAPTEEVTARERLELEAAKQREELVALRSDIIQVNYAKAADLQALIKASSGDDSATSLMSARGQVTADARTNTLLVQDVPQKITEIRNLVTRLDVPVRQVMIDARIVIARDDFSKDLGVRFGGSIGARDGNNTGAISGSSSAANTIASSFGTGSSPNFTTPALSDRLGVSFPVAGSTLGLVLLGNDYLLDLELSALQVEGRGETLSNPRVITTDGREATIQQGEEIPFATVSEEGTQTEFKEAELSLTVTPQITPDGRVIMDIDVKQDERGADTPAGPAINTRQLTTQVLVNNGETVVLGGVFEKITSETINKVPFLGDLPAIGRLFRSNQNINNKFEIIDIHQATDCE